MLLPFGEVQDEGLLELISSQLKHMRDVLEVGDHRGPALLLEMLIVDQLLADPCLLSRQAATLLGQMGTCAYGLISSRHRQRDVDLILQVNI